MNNRQNWMHWIVVGAVLGLLAAAPAAAQTPRSDAEQVRARQRISTMEGVLERAVLNGADNLLRQVDSVMPDAMMVTGQPSARGFRLEGYGLFFDVGVPVLQLSVTWPLRALMNDARSAQIAAELRVKMAQLSPSDQANFAPIIRRLEAASAAGANRAEATAVNAAAAAPSAAAVAPPVAPVDPDVINDPNEGWTREVKAALIEAMLENSGPLAIGADEWLTVAARDNLPRDPQVAGGTVDFSTVVFRVKGSDLADFHARKLTLEDAKARVEVREY